jgi:hypothetical protein
LATGWQRSEATKKVSDTGCGRLRPHLELYVMIAEELEQLL